MGGSYGSVAGIYKCSNPSLTMLETQEARHGCLQYAVSWPQGVSITSILHYGHCSLPSAFHYAMQSLLLHKWAAQETPAELYNNRITLRFVIVDQSGERLVPAAKIPRGQRIQSLHVVSCLSRPLADTCRGIRLCGIVFTTW